MDLRFGKILKYNRTKDAGHARRLQPVQLEHDGSVPAELLGSSASPRSTYLNPLSIMSARFFKITAQFDF